MKEQKKKVVRLRNRSFSIRVTDEELLCIKQQVKKAGMSQQGYAVNALMNTPIINTDGIKTIAPELRRIGNNLNQVARNLNTTGYYNYHLVTENQKELNKIWRQLNQLTQKNQKQQQLLSGD